MHLPSTQLLHSVSLRNYVGFISRLALHPRTYLKLSPLEAASAFSLAPSTSAADASRLPGANSLPASALGTAQAALDATKVAASTAASAVGDAAARATGRTEPSEEHRAELKRRLRVFLDAALDAFGEDRIFWAANVPAGGAGAGATTDEGEETLSEPEKWFELVRESLADLGLEQAALDKIFARWVAALSSSFPFLSFFFLFFFFSSFLTSFGSVWFGCALAIWEWRNELYTADGRC